MQKFLKSFLESLVSTFGAKFKYLAPDVTILISGMRNAKDDFIDDEACSIGETLVLADYQPSVFKRPAT